MNSLHDVGGMHGLGPVEREENEPVFHSAWEKSVFGILFVLTRNGMLTLDEIRHGRERMPPLHFLAARYYETLLYSLEKGLVDRGVITDEVLTARAEEFKRNPDARRPRIEKPELRELARQLVLRGRLSSQREIEARPRFQPGDRIVTRNMNPKGHTRLPRYARGRHGVIARAYGAFIFPDTNAHGLGENPQHLYSVRFDGRELWGEDTDPNAVVYLDLWESYLNPA